MNLEERIDAFVELGKFLKQFSTSGIKKLSEDELNNLFYDAFVMQINRAAEYNGWFTKDNVLFSLEQWSLALEKETIIQWLKPYEFSKPEKKIAIILAGNIPLVGFHDFLSVLISGHQVLAKLSSNDKYFIPLIAQFLIKVNPAFKSKISFTEEKLVDFDAVIATGSDNTARYFEYYFKNKPNIIRHNRNSVAVLNGNETDEELQLLGRDIFQYFGLGCRNVSKIFVPKNYNFDKLFKALYSYRHIIEYKKYENNYDYNKAIYLMSQFKFLENGFFMIKEDTHFSSPIATLFFEYYDNLNELNSYLEENKSKIQCIVSNSNVNNPINFGDAQQPKLWDYADGIDTLSFLQNI